MTTETQTGRSLTLHSPEEEEILIAQKQPSQWGIATLSQWEAVTTLNSFKQPHPTFSLSAGKQTPILFSELAYGLLQLPCPKLQYFAIPI